MKKIIYRKGKYTITARELLFSVIIAILMLALGVFLSEKVLSVLDEKNQEYEQAAKIDGDRELFEYGMRTNVGNAFVSGTLKAVDPVKLPEIDGEWLFIRKTREEYTEHTRTVTHGSGKNAYTTIETYYTWDYAGHTEYHCQRISFLDNEFDYGVIDHPGTRHLTTKKVSALIRYKYEVCDAECDGTLYAKLSNSTISETEFINGRELNEAVEIMCKRSIFIMVIYWIIWVTITAFAVFGFCYFFDNEWIEDKER